MTFAGIGISYISDMPLWAVYLQHGLSSSAIGLIISAAYNLSKKNAQDKITKILLISSASISILYSAPWLYPTLMLFGGISTYILYIYNEKYIKKIKLQMNNEDLSEETFLINRETRTPDIEINIDQDIEIFTYSPKIGIVFFVIWLFLLILSIIPEKFISLNKIYTIFQKFYIVGSIIFGGGPVVFPLLQSYTVDTGLITINDFLTGIALIQSLPGPNFNISAYLGAVIFHKSISQSLLGASIAYLSIFIPGLLLKNAIIPFWQIIRFKQFMKEIFKGVNASATGLIISTIWLLWDQINTSKNSYSYHIVISMIAFVSSEHFDIPAPIIIIIGGIMGIIEWIMK
jgi:chromate transport protein ChrA